jgi:hypothetical protein
MLALGNVVYEPAALSAMVDTPIEAVAVAELVLPLVEKVTVGTVV